MLFCKAVTKLTEGCFTLSEIHEETFVLDFQWKLKIFYIRVAVASERGKDCCELYLVEGQ